jgi:hypothetical protein
MFTAKTVCRGEHVLIEAFLKCVKIDERGRVELWKKKLWE